MEPEAAYQRLSVAGTSASKPEAQFSTSAEVPKKRGVQNWTNTDVVRWLLDIDQKVFVPAAILQNISGMTLLDIKFEELGDVMNIPKDVSPQDKHSLKSLYHHICSLKEPKKTKVGEKWGEDKKDDETFGRLLGHESGWTYDREYNEWVRYLEISGETAIAKCAGARIKGVQSMMQLMVLMVSAFSSLLTSIQMSTSPQGSQHEPTESRRLAGVFHKMTTLSPLQVHHICNAALLVTSFAVTLMSGYVQVRTSAWEAQLQAISEFTDISSKLVALYEDNLSAPLEDRISFTDYQVKVKALELALSNVRLDFSPQQRNAALKDIRNNDPTTWKRVFEFQEARNARCPAWCGAPIELSEPVGDMYDHMLIRFSGEDMGEYTARPETFKEDKMAARKAWRKLQKERGEVVQSAPEDECDQSGALLP